MTQDQAAGVWITLVAALGRNGVIGSGGDLAFRIPSDLRRFKSLTWGHTLVMGRRTWDSIGRPLPGRRSIVLTRQPGWSAPGAEVARSLDQALDLAGPGEVFVVGGGDVYAQALDRADALMLTEVDAEPDGDTFFPQVDRTQWMETEREAADGYAFVRYERSSRSGARPAPRSAATRPRGPAGAGQAS